MNSNFKKEFVSGTLYTGVAKYSGIAISIIVTATLSRLLVPEDFGTIAIATIFIGLLTLLTGSGIGPAIIQNQDLDNNDITDIFSFTIYLGLLGTVIFFICARFVYLLYDNIQLLYVCYILSINVFFSIANIVPNALLFKNKQFKYIAFRTMIIQFVLGIISIMGALVGLGIYSLLVNPVIGSILLFLISYKCYPIKFSAKFNIYSIKKIFSYSVYQIGFNLINYTYRNIDKLLIGKYMGFFSLGYYEKSYRLMMMPLENISNVINPVLQPLFCEYQNNYKFIFEKYKIIIRYFAYIGFPLSIFCFFCAKEIIILLYGDQWYESISVFKILSLSIGIQLVQSAVGAVFQSTGNVKHMFYAGLVSFALTLLAIISGIYFQSLDILSKYIVIAFYISFIIYHWVLVVKIMKSSFISFATILVRPIITAIVVGFVLYFESRYIMTQSLLINLFIKTISMMLILVLLYKLHIIKDIKLNFNFIK